jgi:hypothetical protein
MEGVLFIIIVFGGGMVMLLRKVKLAAPWPSESGESVPTSSAIRPCSRKERLRHEVSELQERMDFAERMLAQQREQERLPEVIDNAVHCAGPDAACPPEPFFVPPPWVTCLHRSCC